MKVGFLVKRYLSMVLMLFLFVSLIGCSKTTVGDFSNASLKFIYGNKNIAQELNTEEIEMLTKILENKSLYDDAHSCGFDEDIALSFGNKVFAIARDDCNIIKDCSSGKYFKITDSERNYIVSVFEKYGGYFPCV